MMMSVRSFCRPLVWTSTGVVVLRLFVWALSMSFGSVPFPLPDSEVRAPVYDNHFDNNKEHTDVVHYFRERYRYVPPKPRAAKESTPNAELCGAAPDFTDYFTKVRNWSRSQFQEDESLLKHLFPGVENKTFIELGAYDGVHWSNTRFFEECLGWSGVLIEASPRVYQNLAKNRPHNHVLSFAPSCNASVRGEKIIQMDNNARPGSSIHSAGDQNMVDVPCGSLGEVLETLQPYTTFFSLDVEQAEPLVLRTIDFAKVKIDVIMTENMNRGLPSVEETRQILTQAGYLKYQGVVTKSDLYIHPESRHQLPANFKAS